MRLVLLIPALLLYYAGLAQSEWKTMTPMPAEAEGRHHPITFTLDGQGYVMGGSGEDDDLKDMYSYDPFSDSWTTLADFPGTARATL